MNASFWTIISLCGSVLFCGQALAQPDQKGTNQPIPISYHIHNKSSEFITNLHCAIDGFEGRTRFNTGVFPKHNIAVALPAVRPKAGEEQCTVRCTFRIDKSETTARRGASMPVHFSCKKAEKRGVLNVRVVIEENLRMTAEPFSR